MKKIITLMIFLIFIMPFNVGAEDIIRKGESLNLERCIEIALKMHPDIIGVRNTVNVNESRIGQARANYYPQINWTSSYNRISSAGTGSFDQYFTGFGLSQNIYDFGKTPSQLKIQNFNLDSSRSDLENVSEQVILIVKQAYLNLKQAEESIPTAEIGVKQAQENFEIATGRYAAGVGNPIEVTDAEVLLANAKLSYIQALYNYKVS